MSIEQPQNLSYLLHIWQVERNGELVWWASLDNPRTGEHQAFADLAELFAFLDERTVNWLQLSDEVYPGSDGETTSRSTLPTSNTRDRYLSNLLRLMLIDRDGHPAWRASLQSPNATERLNFGDLKALMNYLEEKLGESEN